ncbi:MAG TPA: hypothetical protein VJC14_00025 [Candidatus Paceibacterota bacterium]
MEIKFFKTKKIWGKGGIHANPDIFWNILQGGAFFIVVSSGIFGFYLFKGINQEFILSNENINIEVETISKERIDKALEYFREKSKTSTSIVNSPSPIIDPAR